MLILAGRCLAVAECPVA